ncbi:neprilysin-3-like [Aphidius gifuensis]|uniref:neprilysin-3-like n=1 Tax=Aphidius gifuensis TaxID=684658 RepID=UPI001CDBA70E|nr:neprilysin-3-like [Aphidius gifuensis]
MERPSFVDLSTGRTSNYTRVVQWRWFRQTIAAIVVTLLILGVWIFWPSSSPQPPVTPVPRKYELCKSLSCIETAQIMLNNMDKSVNPCDNFYQFACGKFKDNNAIPHGEINTDIYHIYKDKIRQQYQSILEKNETDSDSKASKIAKSLYKKCVSNSKRLPKDTLEKLTNLTAEQKNLIKKTLQNNLEYMKEKNCVDLVEVSHPMALSALYYQTYNKSKLWNLANTMTINIRDTFINKTLDKINWSKNTMYPAKMAISSKLLTIPKITEFPKSLFNASIVDGPYSSVANIPNDYLGHINLINMNQVTPMFETGIGTLSEISSEIIGISGLFTGDKKIEVIPGGILQGIFFGLDRPEHLNYGAFGSVMALRMTQVLTDQEAIAYQLADHYTFDRSCFAKQYGKYEIKNKKKNDENAFVRSNYIHNLGIWLIREVYQEWKKNNKNKNIKSVVGLEEYTQDQQFWLSYANTMCSKNDNLNEYRVIGSLSNLPEFLTDFQCKNNTKMYINNKCKLFA